MREEIENLLTSLGALAEMTRVFYTNCISSGFNEAESLTLSCELIKGLLGVSKNDGK